MKLKSWFRFILCIFLMLFMVGVTSCKKDYKIALENSIRRYSGGDKKALPEIEENLINAISVLKLNKKKNYLFSRLVLIHEENFIKIIYPFEIKILNRENIRIKLADFNEEIVVLCDASNIVIFNRSGNYLKKENLDEKGEIIHDIAIIDNLIVYFQNERLKYYNYKSGEKGLLSAESFKPPYEKYFRVSIIKSSSSKLSLVIGSGGLYHLNLLNYKDSKLLLKDYKISSSKLLYNKNSLYYIIGNTGDWKIVKNDITGNNEIIVDNFDKINDIEIFQEGYIYDFENHIWYKNFNGDKIRVPFKYSISGKIGSYALLEYNNYYYLVNWEKMFSRLKHFEVILPEINIDKKI